MNMNSVGLHQNFILFVENKTKQANVNRRLCCEKCRFSTKDAALFERHVAQHEEVAFSCTLCSHISYSRVESQRHSVMHKGSFPYSCNWCDYGAVRRDYMVKHIQRIHGKTADEGFTIDCALPTTKIEHLSQKGTTDICADTARKFTSCSKVKNSSRFLRLTQPKANAPYIVAKPVHQMMSNQTHLINSVAAQSVTSTACIFPVTKTHIHSVPGTTHAMTEVTQDITNQLSVIVDEAGQNASKTTDHINRLAGKMSVEKNIYPSSLPRVHFGIYADRTIQQKPLLQSQVKATTVKKVLQAKTVPRIPTGLPVVNGTHLKISTTLQPAAHWNTEVRNVVDVPAGQRPLPIPVVRDVQRSVPSAAHPNMPVEQIGQGVSPFPHGTLNTEKLNCKKSHPNVLVKPPLEQFKSIKQSSVQVELLAPLNQPIQHNRPLTVSCPEEIAIPPGCLVELVEVKNVSGTRELELRLVPQLPGELLLGASRNTTTAETAGKLSFRCRVTTENDQPTRLDNGVCTPQDSGSADPQNKLSYQKEDQDVPVAIKDEPETSLTQASGSSNAGSYGASRSPSEPASDSPESPRIIHQTCRAHKPVSNTPELVTPVFQMHSTERIASWSATSKNTVTEGLDRTAAEASPNKHEDTESSYEGLPVISSVFSLCSVPGATLNHIYTRAGVLHKCAREALTSSELGSDGNVNSIEDLAIFRHDLKIEEETGSLTKIVQKCGQKPKKTEDKCTINEEDIKIPEGVETLGDMVDKGSQTCANDLKDKSTLKLCSILSNACGTTASDPALAKSFSTHPNKKVKTDLEADNSLAAQPETTSLDLSMNPTVALVRIPSLEFYSVLESAKKISEKLVEEESVTARPVLCCTLNQQNLQETAIKLVLKRRRSEPENRDTEQISHFDVYHPHKKRKKRKKRVKKCKSSKISFDFHQVLRRGKMAKLCLTPLKEDQLVKLPGPNQPVVVLNHPNPLVQMVSAGVQNVMGYKWITSASGFSPDRRARPTQQCPSFRMKLKKVQGQKYQVTELVLKGVSEKMIL